MNPENENTAPVDGVEIGHFIMRVIEKDLAEGRYAERRWGGSPGDGPHHAAGLPDPARIRTRFPPEPNGHLHIGHAKSIWLNFGLAQKYDGVCHLRFDDTNPEKEEQEYVDSIREAVRWLGYDHHYADDAAHPGRAQPHEYFASDYFDFMHRAAIYLIEAGLAYVDEQTAEQIRHTRGDFTTPGQDSPWRDRSVAENLQRFADMRAGKLAEGVAVLRAKIDMASPNINLRDPAIYRIRHASHHRSGDAWCIYPMYTFAHPIEDALEQITHSICTLEFEDQRPFYDWVLERLCEGGLLTPPSPRQYEFARLNVTHVITSKRKLRQLVQDGHVSGWDDPRMPTLAGLRRRGYTPDALKLFAERSGVTKVSDAWTEYAALDAALREVLEPAAARAMVVLDPVPLILDNWAEVFDSDDHLEPCEAPLHPHHPEWGLRRFMLTRSLWVERSDYLDEPPKRFFRLFPGNSVRLKYGCSITCTGADHDADGVVTTIHARVIPDTKSGTPGADRVKVKGNITWVSQADGLAAEVRLYDHLFSEAQPDTSRADFEQTLNPDSLQVVQARVEPALGMVRPEQNLQFERHGYFVADQHLHEAGGRLVFNRTATLRDSRGK